MSGKQMKKLRKLFKERGLDVTEEALYRARQHNKIVYKNTIAGPVANTVTVQEIQNHRKLPYRRGKKLMKKGELSI